MPSNTLRGEILEICTYHSDDGTSGYLITPEQADKILNLIASKMPEKKDRIYEPFATYEGVSNMGRGYHQDKGWNDAIDSVKSILKRGTE